MILINIDKLKNNPNNPRIIKDEAFAKLVKSIKQFPKMLEKRPIIVDEDMIILGWNMRYKACKEAWLKEVPIDIFTKQDIQEAIQKHKEVTWEDVDEKYILDEFIIKDNVSGWEWDYDMLANEWDTEVLNEWWMDLDIETVDEEKEAIEDDVPEIDETNIIVERWDIFQLGEHRLLCGDSTSIDDVEKLMDWEKADLILTDPPYQINNTWPRRD